MKTCTKCKLEKDTSEFGKHSGTRDKLCSWCKLCHKRATADWKVKNKNWQKEYTKKRKIRYENDEEYRLKCNSMSNSRYHAKYKNNPEYIAKLYDNKKKYLANNLHKYNAWTADYRQRKRNSNRELSELDELVFKEAYHLAKLREGSTGIKWHVDHIVPLRGKNVCGLHVAANIQVIPAVLNLQKGNSHD